MNDEQFELTISDLAGSGTYYADIADELRARDTAQREALARVEAERDEALEFMRINARSGMSYAEQRDTAQAQLAEAEGLLSYLLPRQTSPVSVDKVKTFLASHAQAEQQEARLAEMARESLRPENQRIEPVEPLRVPHPLEAQGVQALDERAAFEGLAKAQGLSVTRTTQGLAFANGTRRDVGDYIDLLSLVSWHFWKARAALATQPAAGKPVAWMKFDGSRVLTSDVKEKAEQRTLEGKEECAFYNIPLYTAPPAAAHGDEAPGTVRVTADWLKTVHRDLDACQKVIWLAGCRPRVPGGFDPAYCEDAQERLKEIDEQIARANGAEGSQHA
jgi:hypothetical protein